MTAREREHVVCRAALRRNAMQNSMLIVQRGLSAEVRSVWTRVLLPPVSPLPVKVWWHIAITAEPMDVRDRFRDEHIGKGD